MAFGDTLYDFTVGGIGYDLAFGASYTLGQFGKTGALNISRQSFAGISTLMGERFGTYTGLKWLDPTYTASRIIGGVAKSKWGEESKIYKFFGQGVEKNIWNIGLRNTQQVSNMFIAGGNPAAFEGGLTAAGKKVGAENIAKKLTEMFIEKGEKDTAKYIMASGEFTGAFKKQVIKGFTRMGAARIAAHVINGALIYMPIAQAIWGLGKTGVKGIIRAMDAARENYVDFGAGYRDTQAAMTMRQRSIQSIQRSKLNARRWLGAEAQYMHM